MAFRVPMPTTVRPVVLAGPAATALLVAELVLIDRGGAGLGWQWLGPVLGLHAAALLLAVAGLAALRRRHAAERSRLARTALEDPLTGLANRRLLGDRLRQAVALAGREGTMVGVLVLGLDRFRHVNEAIGHEAGDELLRAAARRLRELLRGSDTLARPGGDEFALLQPRVRAADEVVRLAERIVEAFRIPFEIAGQQVWSGATVGMALSPLNGTSGEELFKNAHIALDEGKRAGRGTHRLFSADMAATIARRLNLERAVAGALCGDDLELHYQPRVEIETGLITGLEALVRWPHPDYELLSPAEMVAVVEASPSLNLAFGTWTLRRACRQAREWAEAGLPPTRIAVNLSSRLVARPEVLPIVDRALADHGLDPAWLEIEVTETAVLEGDYEAVAANLRALGARGVEVAIDDFGTGYASFGYLRRLPAARLKIDRSFVARLGLDEHDTAIVRAVMELGRTLGIRIVAEGVETPAQLAMLRQIGCHEAQGYYFSRPLPAAAVTAWFAAQAGGDGLSLPELGPGLPAIACSAAAG